MREPDRSSEIGDPEIRHMTPALITRALALAEEPDEARAQRALELLWAQYDPKQGLWTWPNGDIPLWLQHEAVAATRVAYGRTTTVCT